MDRKPIDLNGSTMDALITMSEGNLGAMSVLADIVKAEKLVHLLNLDDMNIRGAQIWIGYKDHCGQNLKKFMQCLNNRDSDMVKTINDEMSEYTGIYAVEKGNVSPTAYISPE